eukprot:TRINITY_DN42031_c0_g1_i1.p1 TRINITY_DN42031_c0_g1~~TRINITY_DN42031_c0_g1_i1.p1  ORF type:complete len:998 (-),score=154.39 TRINITY_DN42031_c0_g1_i1:63-3056(-)
MSDDLQPGDHIRGMMMAGVVPYYHHGIFIGWVDKEKKVAKVIERTSEHTNIQENTYDISSYSLYERPSDPDEAVRRAESRVGERGYNLVFKNCEHFATWCRTGVETSAQVVNYTTSLGAIARNAVDKTTSALIRGVRGAKFAGSSAISGVVSTTKTATHFETLLRVVNMLSVYGVSKELSFCSGLMSQGAPDLSLLLANGRKAFLNVASSGPAMDAAVTGLARARLLAAPAPLPAAVPSRIGQLSSAAQVLQKPLLGLEVFGHCYNVYHAQDRIRAGVSAAGSFGGARAGGAAGAYAGSYFGPWGAAIGGFLGGVCGAFGGDYFAGKLLGWCRPEVGGVDLGGSLHFIDELPNIDNIVLDRDAGLAIGGSLGKSATGPFADFSSHDFATVLKIEYFNEGQGAFSLDAEDPFDPFGPFQKKVFLPGFLAGTDVGELLFRADVLLKRLGLGLEVPALPDWRSPFDLGHSEHSVHRSWIVPLEMKVKLVRHPRFPSAKCLQVADVRLGVLACAQVADPSSPAGLVDAPHTCPQDPACLMAHQCTLRMAELIAYYPTFERLHGLYQMVAICRAMRMLGATVTYPWVELHAMPLFETPGKFATLRNERTTESRHTEVTTTSTRTMVGGCVLAEPSTPFRILEVTDDSEAMHSLIKQAYEHRDGIGSDVPSCYRLGRSMREDRSRVSALRSALERGDDVISLELPSPPPRAGPRIVSLPFVASCTPECAACGRCLAEGTGASSGGGGDGDPVRFQSVLGLPLCSRVHQLDDSFVGPCFRLTSRLPCAGCGEQIRAGSMLTIRSSEEPARDFHADCAPPEDVQRAAESEQTRQKGLAQVMEHLCAHVDALSTEGRILGGMGSVDSMSWLQVQQARLMRFTSCDEATDLHRALRASLEAQEGERDVNLESDDYEGAASLDGSEGLQGGRDGSLGAADTELQLLLVQSLVSGVGHDDFAEEEQLQRAMMDSLAHQLQRAFALEQASEAEDDELALALALSLSEHCE